MYEVEGATEQDLVSRTKLKQERKDYQARLDAITERLTNLPPKVVALFELGEEIQDEVKILVNQKKGSALARQRKRVAGLLRAFDIDEIEKRVDEAFEKRR